MIVGKNESSAWSRTLLSLILSFFFFLDDINDVKETGEVCMYREGLKLVLHKR